MAPEVKKKRKPSSRPRHRSIVISVWTMDGGNVPEEALVQLEQAVEDTKLKLFNEGFRLLSQTSRA